MSRRTAFWLLVVVALSLYSLLVYSWWIEGNSNFDRQRVERENESIILRH